MRKLAVIAIACLVGWANEPTPALALSAPPDGGDCDVTVLFASYGDGADWRSSNKIQSWLGARTDLIASVKKSSWGREGEHTLCATTVSPAAIDRAYKGLKRELPRVSEKGSISVMTRSGQLLEIRPSRMKGKGYEGGHDARARGNGGIRPPNEPRPRSGER